MNLIVVKDKTEMGMAAANIFVEQIRVKPDSLLGLATGSTPIPLYKELIKMGKLRNINFSKVRTVNLDEYIGLPKDHNQSYRYFMEENLFNHISIDDANTALPDVMAKDTLSECSRYDDLIADWGGIDLQLLGIGHNGHIGFNEPGTEFVVKTHVVEIAQKTRKANSRFFDDDYDKVPQKAITMGIGNIMSAQKILLLVSGEDKADILYKSLTGAVTPKVPASVLQLHNNVTIIADSKAAKKFDIRIKQVL